VWPLRYGHREYCLLSIHVALLDLPGIKLFKPYDQGTRPISTGKLNPLRGLHTQPIKLVVYERSSVSIARQGDLILGLASRLDAFSGYPVQT
jgi:hypothetical protein